MRRFLAAPLLKHMEQALGNSTALIATLFGMSPVLIGMYSAGQNVIVTSCMCLVRGTT